MKVIWIAGTHIKDRYQNLFRKMWKFTLGTQNEMKDMPLKDVQRVPRDMDSKSFKID